MIRREFLKLLGGLPFLGFLKGKTEDELDIEDSLESLKEKRGISLENFTETLNTNSSATWYRSGDGYIRIYNGTSHVVFEGQPMFYKDKLEG